MAGVKEETARRENKKQAGNKSLNIKVSLAGKLWSKALHFYFRATRALTLGVRAVVRDKDGKFLLVRHTYTSGWHLPGGGVEVGQTAMDALLDELLQETSLKLTSRPALYGVFLNRDVSKRDHILVYLCEADCPSNAMPLGIEIADVGLFSGWDLPNDVDGGTRTRIEEILSEELPSFYW